MSTAKKMVQWADSQAKVTGTYYGKKFSGTVISSRQVSVRPFPEEITIKLDHDLTVYGDTRDTILIMSSEVDNGKHTVKETAVSLVSSMTTDEINLALFG